MHLQSVKLLEDNCVYLGNQIEIPDSDWCYGILADDHYLLVCEYGCNGTEPQIILYHQTLCGIRTAAYNEVVVCDRRRRKNVRSTFFVLTKFVRKVSCRSTFCSLITLYPLFSKNGFEVIEAWVIIFPWTDVSNWLHIVVAISLSENSFKVFQRSCDRCDIIFLYKKI